MKKLFLLLTLLILPTQLVHADCPTGIALRDIAQNWAQAQVFNGTDPLFWTTQPSCPACSSCAGAGVARSVWGHISGYSDFWDVRTPTGCQNSNKYITFQVWWKPTTWQLYSGAHCGCSAGQTNWSCGWGY